MFGNTLLGLCCASGPPHVGRLRLRCTTASVVLGIGVGAIGAAHADPSIVLPSGLPVQVKPTFQEPGLPAFSFPVGSSSSVDGSSSSVDNSGGSSGGSVSSGGSGDAYNMMMAQDWGSQAEAAASAMGVSATALAATCAMESNCQNVGASSSVSNASGAFQMINSTYTADINGALAYDPDVASSIVSGLAGKMDPGTEAYAASYELRTDALMLQSEEDIPNPTVLDVRAVYQFGGSAGPGVAAASDSDNLESYINLTPAQLAANGLTATETVGQWRQTVIAKLGSATVNQTILTGQ
jgi:hypothetical protein